MNRRTFMAAAAAGVGCAALPVVGEMPVYAVSGIECITVPDEFWLAVYQAKPCTFYMSREDDGLFGLADEPPTQHGG